MLNNHEKTIAFIGNPNSGKSTLFNALTGAKQHIGNWPGVTVELVEGEYRHDNKLFKLVDLPGIYSVSANSDDERVSRDYVLSGSTDLVVNIVDASNLSRNLFLTFQLLEMKVPMVVVLNMMDLAESSGIEIDIEHLSAHLKCPVIGVSAVKSGDPLKLKKFLSEQAEIQALPGIELRYPNEIEELAAEWAGKLGKKAGVLEIDPKWMALRLIEEDPWITGMAVENGLFDNEEIASGIDKIKGILNESPDMIIADYLYGAVNGICREVISRVRTVKPISDIIDSIVMHPVLGVPVFFGVMLLVFFVTIEVGNIFVDWFDAAAGLVFVDGLSMLLGRIGSPEIVTFFAAEGLGAGIQMVISFIPFVFFMFLMLSLLEDSGYMARAAFVMDRFMTKLGLPGKAFVPMIVGFGCTVPAILATRTLDNKRDRIITIFMVPMMSCGARLPVYALFAAAFFPSRTGLIVFSLYMVGVLIAVLSGMLVKLTLYRGEPSHLIMELPKYHVPRIKHIMLHTWARVKDFIRRAGQVIIIAVIILSVFSSLTIGSGFDPNNVTDSLLAVLGRALTPIFTPMGITPDNWPATVGLFTGIFAKESVVGTLNAVYSQLSGEHTATGLQLLKSRFSSASAYSYLLFILLYMPCIAAISTAMKEIGVGFGLAQAVYLTLVAWIVSTLFYQIVEGHNIIFISIAAGMILLIIILFKAAAAFLFRDKAIKTQ